MMKHTEPDPQKLEQMLDQGVERFAEAEPLAGLEDRILARLELQAAAPSLPSFAWRRWTWALSALVLAAGIGTGFYVVTLPPEDVDYEGEGTQIEVKGSAPIETQLAELPQRLPLVDIKPQMPRALQVAMAQPSEVRSEVFPAPQQLSEQDQFALAYTRGGQQRLIATAPPESGIRELEVPELKVAPLRVDELERRVNPERGTSSSK